MAPGDTARLYHELTSVGPDTVVGVPRDDPRLLQDLVVDDLATWPAPCKAYPGGLPVRPLPREWPAVAAPATAVLAGTGAAPPRAAPDLRRLARLLHLSAGVVRVVERAGRPTLLLRAAGSAGGRFPLEVYVSARGVDGLADGVHWSGLVEGRPHVAAYALGAGASGMTFLDSEIAPLLGDPLAGLLLTCVGVPAYRNKRGGGPGAPAPVVLPAPSLTQPEADA